MKIAFSKEPLPEYYLLQISKNCPKALFLYLQLWRKRDKDNQVSVERSKIRVEYLISVAKFRHDLLMLIAEGLLSYYETCSEVDPKNETLNTFSIELVDWQDDIDAEGHLLC